MFHVLPHSLRARALEELGESREVCEAALSTLKATLAAQAEEGAEDAADLRRALEQPDVDARCMRFLRVSKFDVPKCACWFRSTLELGRYQAALPVSVGGRFRPDSDVPRRRLASCFDMGLDHPAVRHVTENGVVRVLPRRALDGSAVLVLSLSDKFLQALASIPMGEFFMAVDRLGDAASSDPQTQLLGITFVVDLRGAPAGLLPLNSRADMMRLNEKRLKQLAGRAGFRTRALWFVGMPWYARGLVNLARAFMPAKIRARIRVAADARALHASVAQSVLPSANQPAEATDLAACLHALRRTHHTAASSNSDQ